MLNVEQFLTNFEQLLTIFKLKMLLLKTKACKKHKIKKKLYQNKCYTRQNFHDQMVRTKHVAETKY
jgi:hypothetical protein